MQGAACPLAPRRALRGGVLPRLLLLARRGATAARLTVAASPETARWT